MSTPTLVAQLALSTRPTEAPAWIDVTERLRPDEAIKISRGRQRELDRFDTGTLTCALDNRDRALDPSYQGVVANLVTNPSFETNISGWASYGTPGSAIRSASLGLYGSCCMHITRQTASGYEGAVYQFSSTAGQTYWITVHSKDGGGSSGNPAFNVRNAAGYVVPHTLLPTTTDWSTTTVAYTSPADETLYLNVYSASGEIGGYCFLDAIQVSPVESTYTDGDQPNCRWAGTAHASESYRGGPYFGDLKPMRRFRLAAILDGVEYPMLMGYVDGFGAKWPGGLDAITPIKADDGFRVLALNEIPAGTAFAEQLSSDRVNAILDLCGWTTGGTWVLDSATNSQLDSTAVLAPVTGDRVILTGNTTVQAETLSDAVNALEYAQRIEDAENGRLLVNTAGAVCFYNRHFLYEPAQQTSRWTFADASDPTALPYADLEPAYDDGDLYNVVTCERRGGVAQTAEDATSKLEYFRRTLSETDLLALTDIEMADRAAWTLARRKAPGYRVKALTIRPQMDDRLWAATLGAELGDRITVKRLPQGIGDPWVEDYRIEHVEWTIQGGLWQVVWQLAPADASNSEWGYDGTQTYWIVSNGADEYAPYAILGTTTVLGY